MHKLINLIKIRHKHIHTLYVASSIDTPPVDTKLIIGLTYFNENRFVKNPNNIPYVFIPLNDPGTEKDWPNFLYTCQLLKKHILKKTKPDKEIDFPVFLHCASGVTRSVAVAKGILKNLNWDLSLYTSESDEGCNLILRTSVEDEIYTKFINKFHNSEKFI